MKIETATIKDLSEITALHCLSFKPEDHVPMMLGENYVRATYKWLITSNESYVLVGKKQGLIIGLIAVCDGPFTKPMFIACFPEFIISLISRPSRLFSKLLWRRLLRRPDIDNEKKSVADVPGFAQMTIGAVDFNCRGSGVFGQLINSTKNFSNKRGSRGVRAGVYKINTASRRVFEKEGWQEMKYLETEDTVFYTAFFDEEFKKKMMKL